MHLVPGMKVALAIFGGSRAGVELLREDAISASAHSSINCSSNGGQSR